MGEGEIGQLTAKYQIRTTKGRSISQMILSADDIALDQHSNDTRS